MGEDDTYVDLKTVVSARDHQTANLANKILEFVFVEHEMRTYMYRYQTHRWNYYDKYVNITNLGKYL